MRSLLPENEVINGRRSRMERRKHPLWSRRRCNLRPCDHHSSWKWRKSKDEEEKMPTNLRTVYMECMGKLLKLWNALKKLMLDPTVVIEYVSIYRSGFSGGKFGALKDHVQQIDALQGTVYHVSTQSTQQLWPHCGHSGVSLWQLGLGLAPACHIMATLWLPCGKPKFGLQLWPHCGHSGDSPRLANQTFVNISLLRLLLIRFFGE